MNWLLILVAVGLVITPVMWLKPTPRQRRVIALRNEARKQGIVVKLEASPEHQVKGLVAAYRWPFPAARPGPDFMLVSPGLASRALKTFEAGWCWRTEPLRPLPETGVALLAAMPAHLPDDVLAIASSRSALTLWWDESLDAERLAALAEPLVALRDALAGHPDHSSNAAG